MRPLSPRAAAGVANALSLQFLNSALQVGTVVAVVPIIVIDGHDLYGDGVNLAARLEGAAPGVDRATMDRMLSSLGSRVFVLNNVHEDAPEVFQTRWTLSYLRGPLTREQIRLANTAAAKAPAPLSCRPA